MSSREPIGGDTTAGRTRTRVRTSSRAPVRLADVAKLAGVSSGTVSRVINQPGLVSPDATAAVMAAIDKLGWVPHGAARALASHRTQTVGVIIPNLANPVFAAMIYALQHRLMAAGHTLIIGCSEYSPERGLVVARAMVSRGIDGLILLGENYPEALWTLLAVQRIPYLIAYSSEASPIAASSASITSARLICRRNISSISATATSPSSRKR
jgi:LacI family transcriptional regulator